MTPYLRPTAPIAPDVLLPSNPADAMALAQHLIEGPLMANHSHGLWGYSGPTAAGAQLTVQSTGIGGPSAAAVLFELAEHGVRRAIRVGYARPLGTSAPDTPIVASAALRGDGASRALGPEDAATPDPGLNRSLLAALGNGATEGTVLSSDLHDPSGVRAQAHPRAAEALVEDLETAAVLAVGQRCGIAAAAGLIAVNGDAEAERERLLALGSACAKALAVALAAAG